MYTSEDLIKIVNRSLSEISYPDKPENLYEPIRYVMSLGGKRIRPVILLLVYNMYGKDIDEALKVAMALEIYHNYTLLHDDLMDNADMRRGHATVHKRWNTYTAILSGDTMLVLAYKYLISAKTDCVDELARIFTQTAIEIGEGQQYDMNFENRLDVTAAEYLEMIRLKTSVLIAGAAKMGAIIGGAPREDAESLYKFGEMIGMAFQLQDDYLDVYGDPAVFGKKIGGDILCNKKTYLLIKALSNADGPTREELLQWLTAKQFDPAEKIRAVTDIYNRLGVADDVMALIDKYFERSKGLFDEVSLPYDRKREVWRFVSSLIGRKS